MSSNGPQIERQSIQSHQSILNPPLLLPFPCLSGTVLVRKDAVFKRTLFLRIPNAQTKNPLFADFKSTIIPNIFTKTIKGQNYVLGAAVSNKNNLFTIEFQHTQMESTTIPINHFFGCSPIKCESPDVQQPYFHWYVSHIQQC